MKISDRLGREGGGRTDGRPALKRSRTLSAVIGNDVFQELYIEVIDSLETRDGAQLDPQELNKRVTELVQQALDARQISLSQRHQQHLVAAINDEILGLGPLETLLADPTVSDILVNAFDSIYIERGGLLEEAEVRFRDNAHLMNTIHRIVARVGRRIDESSPMVDARLPDGSRVNAIIPPLSIDGPVLSIRRFGGGPVSLRDLVQKGTLSLGMGQYLKAAVRAKSNVLVCGGTGAGKTTLLNALSRYISSRERVVTIEDSAELKLQQRHVVRLETRPANVEGQGEVSIRDLVRNALRMRPDRIIVGEVRASEVLDMIQAMNTGHEGSMTTVHANSVEDAFSRLMAMLSMAGTPLSETMMAQMVARALHVIVHVTRELDGRRRISAIAEVAGVEGSTVRLNELFSIRRGEGRSSGSESTWVSSGSCLMRERLEAAGLAVDPRWFGLSGRGEL